MSAEAVRTAVGEDGVQIAVDALKQIARDELDQYGASQRLDAAQTLLQYGLAYVDDFGNAATR